MDSHRIAAQLSAEKRRNELELQRENERARRQVARARATASRLRVIEEHDGVELRVRPRSIWASLTGLESYSDLALLVPLCIPCAFMVWIARVLAPDCAGSASVVSLAAYAAALGLLGRWYFGFGLLRISLTHQGNAALWHRGQYPNRPTWVGPKGSFRVQLNTFARHNVDTGSWDRRHGWTEIGFILTDRPFRRSGPAYFLNDDDAATVREVLKRHGVLW